MDSRGMKMFRNRDMGVEEIDPEVFRGKDLEITCLGYDVFPEPGRMRLYGEFEGGGRSITYLIHGDRRVHLGIDSTDFSAWATRWDRNYAVPRLESKTGSLFDAMDMILEAFRWATGNPEALARVEVHYERLGPRPKPFPLWNDHDE